MKILKETMGDSEKCNDSWIEWWLCEGREVWDENGNKIPLETPEELYDFLVKLNEKKGENL